MNRLILLLAQGMGIGRIPAAPGTFGSILGLAWFALLLWPGRLWILAVGSLAGVVASVYCCGKAERILKQTDPGSVVLDEISAIPLCFAGYLTKTALATGRIPELGDFLSREGLIVVVMVFALFRLFDIAKPWPVRQSQTLPGGWGVTVDDMLAAAYTAIVSWLTLLMFEGVGWLGR